MATRVRRRLHSAGWWLLYLGALLVLLLAVLAWRRADGGLTAGLALALLVLVTALFLLRLSDRRAMRREADLARRVRAHRGEMAQARARLEEEAAERSRREALSREHAQRLEEAAELARLGYCVWDVAANRCVHCSDQMSAAFGVTPEAFRARASHWDGPLVHVHPEDRERVRAAYSLLAGGSTVDTIYRTNAPAGSRRLREIARPVRDAAGEIVKHHFACVDITDQHEMNTRLAQAQRMENIGRMTGGIVHDFNNLLAVILGNLELMDMVPDPSERQAMAREATAAVMRGRDLTRSMLGFARREPVEMADLDLGAAVRAMLPLIRRTLPTNIALRLEIAPDLWAATGDRSLTDSALLNLVINARDAMPEGGRLTISLHNSEGAAEEEGDGAPLRHVVLSVADTGKGIDPEVRDRIFQPFVTTKAARTNSGLGLSMVQSFIRQAGGRVEVDTAREKGSTFRLYFRSAEGGGSVPQIAGPGDAAGPEGRDGYRILVVEDDPGVRKVLALQLGREGHDVTVATDGEEALDLAEAAAPFDLMVSDVVMPGAVQGPDLAQALRARQPGLAAILLSGYPQLSDTEVPGCELLLKPLNRQDLLRAVARAMDGRG